MRDEVLEASDFVDGDLLIERGYLAADGGDEARGVSGSAHDEIHGVPPVVGRIHFGWTLRIEREIFHVADDTNNYVDVFGVIRTHDALTDRISAGPELVRHHLIDDR